MYEGMLRCFSFQFELRHKLCCTNFPDKGIVDVNFLLAVAAALVTLIKRKSDKDRILIYLGFCFSPADWTMHPMGALLFLLFHGQHRLFIGMLSICFFAAIPIF